ncbi:hypothetical protein PYW07_015857 [Mythimna separata]|uniref:LITAF domain-containing protein n=1 Tax=Mythimna separata TaxID=271217 RepID=A0AAD8DUT4_MYTSE|nr:hypothetical protein PYW07_015857 [Mythimna separata]
MNNHNEDLQDPKGQGQPPPYTTNNAPQIIAPQVLHPTGMMPQTMQPMFAPVGQPVHTTMGHSIHIQHGTMVHPMGMYQSHPMVVPMVVGNQMGPKPSSITCQSCKEIIVTRVEAKTTMKTHLISAMLCFMCCWPCVFIPYCMDTCRNADHYCPNCNSYIGSYVH